MAALKTAALALLACSASAISATTGTGSLCDLDKCVCNGTDISMAAGDESGAEDAKGFSYWFSLCQPLAPDILPGCLGITNDTAVVKYNKSDPSSCEVIGTESTMAGVHLDTSVLNVTFDRETTPTVTTPTVQRSRSTSAHRAVCNRTFLTCVRRAPSESTKTLGGCHNSFSVVITTGSSAAPSAVTETDFKDGSGFDQCHYGVKETTPPRACVFAGTLSGLRLSAALLHSARQCYLK